MEKLQKEEKKIEIDIEKKEKGSKIEKGRDRDRLKKNTQAKFVQKR